MDRHQPAGLNRIACFDRKITQARLADRHRRLVVAAMTACVLGWWSGKRWTRAHRRSAQGERDIRNLPHSLAEHASHSIQAADVAMSGIVDILKYQQPRADRLNLFLRNTVAALPQIREIAVLDTTGDWIYSSVAETPRHNNYDRSYFTHIAIRPTLRCGSASGCVAADRPATIILSRRIVDLAGQFQRRARAAIDTTYFDSSLPDLQTRPTRRHHLARRDGSIPAHRPTAPIGSAIRRYPPLFKTTLEHVHDRIYRITSPYDGHMKYLGFERASHIRLSLPWHFRKQNCWPDGATICVTMRGRPDPDVQLFWLAVLLSRQFVHARREKRMRKGQARYSLSGRHRPRGRLLDRDGAIPFVSQSVEVMLGAETRRSDRTLLFRFRSPGRSCSGAAATAELTDRTLTRTAMFRTRRADGSVAWVEFNFKLAAPTQTVSGSRWSAPCAMSPSARRWRPSSTR